VYLDCFSIAGDIVAFTMSIYKIVANANQGFTDMFNVYQAIPVSMPFVYFVYYDLCALERISIYTRCTRYQGHRPVLIRSSLITAMSIGTFIVLNFIGFSSGT